MSKKEGVVLSEKEKHATNVENGSRMNFILAILLLLVGIVGYYYFISDASKRLIAFSFLIGGSFLFLVLFYFSEKGRRLLIFLKESKRELGRVTWPTRDETKKMTLMVLLVMGVVLAYLLLADWILHNLVTLFLRLFGGIN